MGRASRVPGGLAGHWRPADRSCAPGGAPGEKRVPSLDYPVGKFVTAEPPDPLAARLTFGCGSPSRAVGGGRKIGYSMGCSARVARRVP
jgi:hypothetical protein